jgi:hypothetical protein
MVTTPQRLRPLLFVYPPFDFLEDERVQDELIDGGVRDLMLVFGHLFDDRPNAAAQPLGGRTKGRFVRDYYATERRGEITPVAFRATPELYAGLGALPPELPPGMEDKSERLGAMIAQLAGKGVQVCVFGYGGAGPDGRATWESPEAMHEHRWDYVQARIRDFRLHFPGLAGFVTDGPGFGYEITPGFTGGGPLTFAPLPTDAEARSVADDLGVDLSQIQAASDRLPALLQGLTPQHVDLFLDSHLGVFDGIDLFMEDDAIVDLLRFKTAATERHVAATYRAIKAVDTRLEYGICPRLPCFAAFQGCNFRRLNRITDYIQSKHYLWTGGRDGFRGTLERYQQTLRQWNPALDDGRIEGLMCRLLGIELPADYRIADFGRPSPKSFFDDVVYHESRKMLFRIGDAERISPFVGLEHGGSPWMTAEELELLFQSMVDAGLTRFTYYTLNDISDEIWQVMTRFTAP